MAVFDEEAARDEAAEAEAEDDEARGALRGALDAVDLASRNAISRRFDVESVKELARECARARRAAGVRDLRFVDDADDELARESRLEEARAKCRAKVAEAEADFLRREAEEAKEKYISRYGDAGSRVGGFSERARGRMARRLRAKVDDGRDVASIRRRRFVRRGDVGGDEVVASARRVTDEASAISRGARRLEL